LEFFLEQPQAQNPERRQSTEITRILKSWSGGNREAVDDLIPLVYDELHKVAAQYLRRQRSDHTLQPTALVNEAYLKLIDISNVNWHDRAHFFAVASQTMRHILVDHARAQMREKRGGGVVQKLSLDEAVSFSKDKDVDVLLLDEALRELATIDEQQCKIVELRFFGGLTVEETAVVLKISPATVKREWRIAKAWLFKKMEK
jgi:RNA polymerase sigma factor (TIGR02999 family)